MKITFSKLHPHFVAEVHGVDLREAHDRETLDQIQAGMDEYGVLVFRNQPFSNEEQLAFAERFDGIPKLRCPYWQKTDSATRPLLIFLTFPPVAKYSRPMIDSA
jgi:hypothetical protein